MRAWNGVIHWASQRRQTLIPSVLGLICVIGFYAAYVTKPPAIEQVGNLLFDRYQNWKPRQYHADVPVRIIDIDDESLAKLGQWPWPRTVLADLHDRLGEAGAAVVAYDVIFSETDRTSPENILQNLPASEQTPALRETLSALPQHDVVFAESLRNPPSVLGFFMMRYPGETAPQQRTGFAFSGGSADDFVPEFQGTLGALPILGASAAGEAFVSFNPSGDGIVRLAPLTYRVGETYYPALSIDALRAVQGAGAFIVQTSSGNNQLAGPNADASQVARIKVGAFDVPTTEDGGFRVYYTPSGQAENRQRILPAWKILDRNTPLSEWGDQIAGHIVFIGTGAEGLKDIVATPVNAREPGVVVHAQIAEQIIGQSLHGNQLLTRPYWVGMVERLLIVIPGLILLVALPRLGSFRGFILSAAAIIGIAAYSWISFSRGLTLINPVYPILAIMVAYVVMTVSRLYLTEVERSRIRSAFSMYLSPEMVRQVSDDPGRLTLGGEERDMTILFLDVRSFSRISEHMSPQDITTFLNIFLTPMTNTLQEMKATIDKYIGDAIVAFWNAPLDDPDHPRNAARAVLKMHSLLRDLNVQYGQQTDVIWPEDVAMGIGLNTGICCVGNLGSDQRFSYSMIGDAANLASRIEGLTKLYRVGTLIGQATADRLHGFAILEADRIQVIGRQTPETVWLLVGDEETCGGETFQHWRGQHEAFLTAYRQQDWATANDIGNTLTTVAEPFGVAGYYAAMTARIAEYQTSMPMEDWDGVYIATEK